MSFLPFFFSGEPSDGKSGEPRGGPWKRASCRHDADVSVAPPEADPAASVPAGRLGATATGVTGARAGAAAPLGAIASAAPGAASCTAAAAGSSRYLA